MSDVESEPRPGWAGRVAVSSGPGAFAYVPEQVVTSEPDRARELAVDLFPQNEIQVDALQNARGRYSRLRRVPDVPLFVRHLRAFGVQAQPNHVFFAHCDDPCCGRPHPALRCGGAGGAGANPVYASPVYASPVYASPVYASPVYASPVYASPVYASPVYASPVYASPVYASEYLATGRRASSARPVTPADAADLAKALGLIEAPKKAGEPDVVVLDTGLSCQGTFRPAALANLESLVTPGGGAGQAQDVPDAVPVPPDTLLDPAAATGRSSPGWSNGWPRERRSRSGACCSPRVTATRSASPGPSSPCRAGTREARSSTCRSAGTSSTTPRSSPPRCARRRPTATWWSHRRATTASAARRTRPPYPAWSAWEPSAPAGRPRSPTSAHG